ncbi:hypothetical protein [Mesorhizobium sp. WSM2239]|uniref:Sorbosone dehydrogenase n=2 Tax=unclassified Mesorhizobium TaxID=325217 RepID=A0AAU8DAC5_9HYPH
MKRILIAILILAVLAILAGVAVFLMTREEAPVPVEQGYGARTGSLGRPVGIAIDWQRALLVADNIGNKVWRVVPR